MSETSRAESTAVLRGGLQRTGWTLDDLWVAVVAIGGGLGRHDIEGITRGRRAASPAEHDVLAATLNDYLADRQLGRPVAFWDGLLRGDDDG